MQMSAFSQDWIESFKDESVSIEISKITHESPSDGISHERLIFKYVNLTENNLEINYSRKVAYDGQDLPNSQEREFQITVPSHGFIEYDDSKNHNKLFYQFISDNKGTISKKLTGFEITNIEYEVK